MVSKLVKPAGHVRHVVHLLPHYIRAALRRCITDEFSRRGPSLKTNQVLYSRLLRQVPPFLTGVVQSLLPCTPRSSTLIYFSYEGLVIGDHSVHLWEESGLARDQRMPPAECPEQTLTLPM